MSETFPITTAAWARLRASWHLWWAGYHLFATIERLEKIGADRAATRLKTTYIYDFPKSSNPQEQGSER